LFSIRALNWAIGVRAGAFDGGVTAPLLTIIAAASTLVFHGCNAGYAARLSDANAGANSTEREAPTDTRDPATEPVSRSESREFDFGNVVEGTELRHTFSIRNSTEAPLIVRSFKKSCSCEAADLKEGAVIASGEALQVTYALSKYGAGERRGQLVIATDSDNPSLRIIELNLHAQVQPKLWATPPELELEAGSDSSDQLLRIESIVPGLLNKFKNTTTNRGNVTIALTEKTDNALIFRVVVAPDAPWGTSYDLIYVSFDDREHPSLNIRVRSRKGHPLAVIPAKLTLPAIADGQAQTRKVRIMSPAASVGGFRITNVECPEGIAVGAIPVDARHQCDINLTIQQPKSPLGERAVVFHTDPPGAVTLLVRYTAAAKPIGEGKP
jgi:hypothetical protein